MNYFNYFSEIEETFNRRRGKHLFLSALDWALIETWQERGVPLHVVLRGIERVFDTADAQAARRKRSVKSLMYCREEIEAQHEEWLERQIGKSETETDEAVAEKASENENYSKIAVAEYLRTAKSEIAAAAGKADGDLREILERAAARLSELQETFADAETLEESLTDLEKLIDAELLKTFADGVIKTEIEKQLAAYRGKMETDAYRHTFDLMLLKRLREESGIPRLSLFYL